MMGADGPRTYFMGFQTNAEARGTGGLLGGFGILRFDNGNPIVETLGPNTELDKPFTPIDLGPEYNAQYGFQNPTTDFRNSNREPTLSIYGANLEILVGAAIGSQRRRSDSDRPRRPELHPRRSRFPNHAGR